MRSLPDFGKEEDFVKIDLAHTYAISGYGKDELASTLIFLAVRCGLWGQDSFEKQLEEAYGAFKEWCAENGKTTTVMEFSKVELKITSFLGNHTHTV